VVDGVSEPGDLGGQPPLAGLQDPAVGLGEAGEVEGQELVEGALGLVEAGLELAGGGPERRGGGCERGGRGAAWVAEPRLAGRRVGRGVPGGEQRLGLARAQPVAHDRVGQPRLLAARQARESSGRGGGQAPGIDVGGDVGGEAPAERQAAIDPGAAAPEQRHDPRRREVIVIGQRAHHARLVHRAQRAPRGVGLEQARLGHHAGGVFDHHGHARGALAGPLGQALEAVDHLVGAVPGRRHPQGQGGERAGAIRARAPQRRQRRRQLRDRQLAHAPHGGAGSTGNSW
jgi:hypothetical protein